MNERDDMFVDSPAGCSHRTRFRRPLGALLVCTALAATSPTRAQIGVDTVGVCAHVPDAAMLDASAALGVRWVRLDANWRDLHTGPGTFDYATLDASVDGATARGLSSYLTLAYTPDWVARVPRTRTDTYGGNDEPASSVEWVAFVDAAVRHYRARGVTHFGIWNEANLDGFWEEAAGLDAWVDTIAIPGAAAVRAACADCVVLGPDFANVGESDAALDRVFSRLPAGTFDIVTHHIYQGFGGGVSDSFLNALEHRRNAVTRASLREVLELHGYDGEIWITETGYRATPGDAADELVQAEYVQRVLGLQAERAWWTATFFYEIMDCGVDAPTCPIDGFGVTRPTRTGARSYPADFRDKPAFDSIRDAIAGEPSLVGGGPTRACQNGADDDGDGRIDLSDRGCASQNDDEESFDPPRRTIVALAAPTAPVVDGDLGEWTGFTALTLETDWFASAIGVPGTGPTAAGDLGVGVAARWSGSTLYLAFDVTDDVHVEADLADTLWQADSLQLAFDVGADGGDGYDADDHEWGIGMVAGRSTVTTFAGTGEPTAVAAVSGRRARYEVAIPAALLGGALTPGARLRFSFLVNEDDGATTPDGTGREGWLELTGGIGTRKRPELFGEIEISATRPPLPGTDAGPTVDAGGTAPAPIASSCACAVPGAARTSRGARAAALGIVALVLGRMRGRARRPMARTCRPGWLRRLPRPASGRTDRSARSTA